DRTPTPKYPEAKRAYQWVAIEAEDLAAGKIRVRNKYQFTNLKRFDVLWTVTEDGKVMAEGPLPSLDLAPGAATTVTVPLPTIMTKPGAEYFLRLSFRLHRDERWAKAGWEAAAAQFPLPLSTPRRAAPALMPALTVQKTRHEIVVTGERFKAVFERGLLRELAYDGLNVLTGGPRLHVYRAPHLNDDLWAARDWRLFGLDALAFHASKVRVLSAEKDMVRIAALIRADGRPGMAFSHAALYTVCGDGTIAVDNSVLPLGRSIALARVGVRLFAPKSLDHFAWLGRGPMENYPDRKRGSDIGLYDSTVREQLTPYVRPMECGNHEDVRWAALTDEAGAGVIVIADAAPLAVSALPYADEQLEKAAYPHELPESEASVVCVSAKTLGLGSNGCGPTPLPQYVIRTEPTTFSYVLRPVRAGEKDLAEVARRPLPGRVQPVRVARDPRGLVTLACDTPGAKLTFSIGDGPTQTYTAPFDLKDGGVLYVRARASGLLTFKGRFALGKLLDRAKWRIASASSFQPQEGEPQHAIDGKPAIRLGGHSRWQPDAPPHPHELVIDFGDTVNVAGVVYHPRQDSPSGRVRDYELYLSPDGSTWGQPALKGIFENRPAPQTVLLPQPVPARYLRFVAKSEVAGRPFAAVAELDVIAADR
ncbi:MAG: DUF4981 domain-containing protein, partial [Planctomycetes bacterium]|nr:DUF4981 domain-containing protein [Planctomycetota bacterium]